MLGVPQEAGVRYHDRGNGAQPRDDLSCVVEPTHMGVAGGEIRDTTAGKLGSSWIARSSFGTRLIEAPAEKCATPITASDVPMRARGLRRSAASTCSIAMSGWPAHSLRAPLM